MPTEHESSIQAFKTHQAKLIVSGVMSVKEKILIVLVPIIVILVVLFAIPPIEYGFNMWNEYWFYPTRG